MFHMFRRRPRYSQQAKEDIDAGVREEFFRLRANGMRVWPIWHRTCRDIAFFYQMPPAGRKLESRYAYDYNGNHPEPHSDMICCACGEAIKPIDLMGERPGEPLAMPGHMHPIQKALRQL